MSVSILRGPVSYSFGLFRVGQQKPPAKRALAPNEVSPELMRVIEKRLKPNWRKRLTAFSPLLQRLMTYGYNIRQQKLNRWLKAGASSANPVLIKVPHSSELPKAKMLRSAVVVWREGTRVFVSDTPLAGIRRTMVIDPVTRQIQAVHFNTAEKKEAPGAEHVVAIDAAFRPMRALIRGAVSGVRSLIVKPKAKNTAPAGLTVNA